MPPFQPFAQVSDSLVEAHLDAALGVTTSGTVSVASIDNCCVFCDYIFLDTDERRRFAQVSHEYLIEQVQHQSRTAGTSETLNFNHPVKELVWVMMSSGGTALPTTTNLLQLNGHDRFKVRSGSYFTDVQRYQHHTGSSAPTTGITALTDIADETHVYSFALKPEEHQPSGTCNFSNVDTSNLMFTLTKESGESFGAVNNDNYQFTVLKQASGSPTITAGELLLPTDTAHSDNPSGNLSISGTSSKTVVVGAAADSGAVIRASWTVSVTNPVAKTKALRAQGQKINLSLSEMTNFFRKMAAAVKSNRLKPGQSIPGCNNYFLGRFLKETMLKSKTYLFCAVRPETKFLNYTLSTLQFAATASVVKLKPKKPLQNNSFQPKVSQNRCKTTKQRNLKHWKINKTLMF